MIANFETVLGIEVVDYKPRSGFIASAENGASFEVDLSEGDWVFILFYSQPNL